MTGTQLTAYDKQLAELAAQQQVLERGTGREFLTTRGGILKYADEPLPGDQIACVILDVVREHAFYPEKFSEDNKVPPTCYAFGRGSENEMFPHVESMIKDQSFFMPQHFDAQGNVAGCAGCPKFEWGTADVGNGKACKSKYRVTLLPAGVYEAAGRDGWTLNQFDQLEEFEGVEPAYLSVPVTSGKLLSDYTRMLRTKHGRPPLGVYTRIHLTRHEKHQFHVNFDYIGDVPNELLGLMIERGAAETSEPFKGYEAPALEDRAAGNRFAGRR